MTTAALTSVAMQQKIRNGEYTGGRVRYGYRLLDDGSMQPDPQEQKVITAAVELSGRGLGLRAVSRALAERGYLSRTGRRFVPHQVAKMIDY